VDMTYGRLTISYHVPPWPIVIEADIKPNTGKNRIWWPFMPISCVSIAKRLLGINKPFILTSKQFYSYLTRQRKWDQSSPRPSRPRFPRPRPW